MSTSTRAGPRDERSGRPLAFDLWVAIGRPPAAVFAFLVDVQEHEPIPRRAAIRMTKIPAGPTAAGTRWHEQVRLMPGWWMTVDSVVTDIDEPAVLGMDFRSSWCTGHLTYTIEATPEGSILHQRETPRPRCRCGRWRPGWTPGCGRACRHGWQRSGRCWNRPNRRRGEGRCTAGATRIVAHRRRPAARSTSLTPLGSWRCTAT